MNQDRQLFHIVLLSSKFFYVFKNRMNKNTKLQIVSSGAPRNIVFLLGSILALEHNVEIMVRWSNTSCNKPRRLYPPPPVSPATRYSILCRGCLTK